MLPEALEGFVGDSEAVTGSPSDKTTTEGSAVDPSAELDAWSKSLPFETTAQVEVPPRLLDQVIGQDDAVEIAKKAATQKRHMLLIGEPGTGKSMLARSMVDFLPKEQLQDILAYPNVDDPNEPKIRVVPAGKGKEIVSAQKLEVAQRKEQRMILVILAALVIFGFALYIVLSTPGHDPTAILVALLIVLVIYVFALVLGGPIGLRERGGEAPRLAYARRPSAVHRCDGRPRGRPPGRRQARPVPIRGPRDPTP